MEDNPERRKEDMKKKAADLENQDVGAGYVYWSTMYQDLIDMVIEYLGETEHQGIEPHAGEVSQDSVESIDEFTHERKIQLRKDFLEYWNEADY